MGRACPRTHSRRLLDNVRVWAGVHPYGAADFNASPEAHRALEALLASPRAVGVGEFGLDYGPYNKTDPSEQRVAFATQLRLAHELNLPVELHLRDADGDETATAHAEAAQILEREGVPAAGCDLHCYTSNAEVMRPFVEMGCLVAFGGAATFPRSDDIREAAVACPAQRLLSETDSPYMAPVPLRGQECEPAMVAFSAGLVARVREEAGVATRARRPTRRSGATRSGSLACGWRYSDAFARVWPGAELPRTSGAGLLRFSSCCLSAIARLLRLRG